MAPHRLDEPASTVIAASVAAVVLLSVTLFVAWALEDIIYFSLFVAIPAGIVSAALTLVVSKRVLGHSLR